MLDLYAPTTPAKQLARLIADNAFQSRLEAYLDEHFRGDHGMEWYKELLNTEGLDAAEAQLTNWVTNGSRDLYTELLEPIAEGVLRVAEAKPELLVNAPTSRQTHSEYNAATYTRLIFWNEAIRGCGCVQPEGSHVYGPSGELELQAIVLEYGQSHRGRPIAKVSLIVPRWTNNSKYTPNGSFAQLEFRSEGSDSGMAFMPFRQTDTARIDDVERLDAIRYVFDIEERPEGVVIMQGLEGMDAAGFPGAASFIFEHLPALPGYLHGMANRLTTGHRH